MVNLTNNTFLTTMIRGLVPRRRQQSKYREIWNLDVLFNYIRSLPPIEEVSEEDQMARGGIVLTAMVPLRPIEIIRLNPQTEVRSLIANSIEVETRQKTDTKSARTRAVLRPVEEKCFCPLTHYYVLKRAAARRGITDGLFWNAKGKRMLRSDGPLKLIKAVMVLAGIA
jgi:hypothetical protein